MLKCECHPKRDRDGNDWKAVAQDRRVDPLKFLVPVVQDAPHSDVAMCFRKLGHCDTFVGTALTGARATRRAITVRMQPWSLSRQDIAEAYAFRGGPWPRPAGCSRCVLTMFGAGSRRHRIHVPRATPDRVDVARPKRATPLIGACAEKDTVRS